ncbi:MAG: hypothetical protein N2112_00450 [Gemmataceae bacterium]|jgi:hypothetical protein|nr:hypothetical protein [Gemmataceae bacterium]
MLTRIAVLLGITLGITILSDPATARNDATSIRIAQKDKKDPPKEAPKVTPKDKKEPAKETPKVTPKDKKDPPKEKPEEKKDPAEKINDSWPKIKGTLATILKVDLDKKTVDFKMNGKPMTLKIGDDVKFFGPQGGAGDGFKDDRFVVGRNVKLVFDEKDPAKLKEVHLDYRRPIVRPNCGPETDQ